MRVAHQLGEHPPGFHGAPVTSIAVDRRGRTLLAGGLTLRLYDAMSGVSARVWGPSRQWLAFGTVTGRVGVVDASGKDLRELSAEEAFSSTSSRVHALAVHPTRPLLAIAHGHDASVRLWNAETGAQILLFDDPDRARSSDSMAGPGQG